MCLPKHSVPCVFPDYYYYYFLVIIANYKTFIQNIAILKYQYTVIQTQEVSHLLYVLLKPVKICVTTDSCIIQRRKNYNYPNTLNDRIPLVTNNNKAILQAILAAKVTNTTFRVTIKQKKEVTAVQVNKFWNLLYTSVAQHADWHWLKSAGLIQYRFNLVLMKRRKSVNF